MRRKTQQISSQMWRRTGGVGATKTAEENKEGLVGLGEKGKDKRKKVVEWDKARPMEKKKFFFQVGAKFKNSSFFGYIGYKLVIVWGLPFSLFKQSHNKK